MPDVHNKNAAATASRAARSSENTENAGDAAPPTSPRSAGLRSETIGSLVRYAHRALVRVLADDLAPWDISTAQWSALRVLWDDDGYSQVELAKRMRVEKAALTGVLESLERKRLIVRVRYEDDRRKFNVFLTAAGRALSRQLMPLATQVTAKATVGISDSECAILKDTLSRIIENCRNYEDGSGDRGR